MGASRQLRVATEAACKLLHERCSSISHTASDNVLGNRIAPILSWFGTGALEESSMMDKKRSKEHILQPVGDSASKWMGAESVNWIEANDFASAKKLRAELPHFHHHVQHHLSAPNQCTTLSSNLTPSFWQHNAPIQALAHISSNIFASTNGNRLYSTRNSPSATGSKEEDEEGADGEYVEESGEWDDGAPLYETILAEVVDEGRVGLITINRPDKLNALSAQVMDELQDALQEFDMEPTVKAIILTGAGNKAFAAGADIKEMRSETFVSAYMGRLLSGYEKATAATRKPIIAAVNGYALGGGCELAMMCDIILAGENAVFGQPETTLGVIPGMGGTQRLIRAVGKSRAMEMILSGAYFMDAREAVARGLASRVVEGGPEKLLTAAVELAKKIARLSSPVVAMAKEAVNSANDLGLSEGVKKEGLLFDACFGLEDQEEGMTAFLEKRKAQFKDK